ncbi:hypothetical protein J4Q44_G00189310, partial [Coregonus suidteri]
SFLFVRSSSECLSLQPSLLTFFSTEAEPTTFPSSSGQTSSSQQRPGTLTGLCSAQPSLGRESCWGHRDTHPKAPSMHVHWCLQLALKLSPFW